MMIMEGSKMSTTEYDLKAIMYSAYDTPHKLCNISGNQNIQPDRDISIAKYKYADYLSTCHPKTLLTSHVINAWVSNW